MPPVETTGVVRDTAWHTQSMSRSTTIKVPVELRDRLAATARREGITLAEAVERALDAGDEAAFWAEVRSTMHSTEVGQAAAVAGFTHAVSDGLEPEDWSEVL